MARGEGPYGIISITSAGTFFLPMRLPLHGPWRLGIGLHVERRQPNTRKLHIKKRHLLSEGNERAARPTSPWGTREGEQRQTVMIMTHRLTGPQLVPLTRCCPTRDFPKQVRYS